MLPPFTPFGFWQMFRYSTALEKHKLFISGLPFSCTKEELEDLCKEHGTVKDIRLVTNRAGKPKVSVRLPWPCPTSAETGVILSGLMPG